MESSTKAKNIFVLLIFFLLGLASGLILSNVEKESIQYLVESIREKKVIGESITVVEQEEPLVEEKIEIVQEVDICPIRVDISGAVKNPGVYCLEQNSAVVDLVKKAGGLSTGVAAKYLAMRINLASILYDNSKIYIPFEEDSICEVIKFTLPKEVLNITEPKPPKESESEEIACISINSASSEQLQSLTGVGPSTAQKIIDGRPYEKIEDILNVSGIGQATYGKFKDQICL